MDPKELAQQLAMTKEWFDRSTRCLTEEDSTFTPSDGTFSAAQQVAHVAQTVDWFMEGAFRPEGFDMDFEGMDAEVRKVDSLAAARQWLDKSFAAASDKISASSAEDLAVGLPEGPIMSGQPRFTIIGAIGDHTSHHRGVLTVYSRLRGHTPAMPYMEM